jgi:predicted alpha/beta-hydrolase family hydrolase
LSPARGRRPSGAGGLGLLLAPGASAGRDQPALVAIDKSVSALGVAVARMDFPYRLAGRRAPDKPAVLVDAVRRAAAGLAESAGINPERLVLGGRSMGGRMCSVAVAEGLPARALVLVSYPLHPPGKPDRPRTEHFPHLAVPCFFVSGTRDAFGSPAELEAATAAIPGPVEHHWIEGGDHGLRGRDQAVASVVADWMASLA